GNWKLLKGRALSLARAEIALNAVRRWTSDAWSLDTTGPDLRHSHRCEPELVRRSFPAHLAAHRPVQGRLPRPRHEGVRARGGERALALLLHPAPRAGARGRGAAEQRADRRDRAVALRRDRDHDPRAGHPRRRLPDRGRRTIRHLLDRGRGDWWRTR